MSRIDFAIGAMNRTLKSATGRRATYTRGSSSIPIIVQPGKSGTDQTNEENVVTHMTADDFLIDVPDLVFNGQQVQPRLGDRITVDSDNYDLMDIPGGACWRFSDQTRTVYRVHVRSV